MITTKPSHKCKVRVAFDAIRENLTLVELSKALGLHSGQISDLKRAQRNKIPSAFGWHGSDLVAAVSTGKIERRCTPRLGRWV